MSGPPDYRDLLERVMRSLVRHHPFDHDCLADEKKCSKCALLHEVGTALRVVPPEGEPPSDGPDELEQLRESLVRAMESDLQISAPYRTIRERAEAEVAALIHAALRRGGQPPSDGMPSEPSEAAIEAAMSFADGDAASHTSIRGSDYSRKEWTRLFLAAAYAAERGVSAVPPTEEPNER